MTRGDEARLTTHFRCTDIRCTDDAISTGSTAHFRGTDDARSTAHFKKI